MAGEEEAQTFLRWAQGIADQAPFESKEVVCIDDLCDGAVLFEILTRM